MPTLKNIWSLLFLLLGMFAFFTKANPQEEFAREAQDTAEAKKSADSADHWGWGRGYGFGRRFYGGYYGNPYMMPYYGGYGYGYPYYY